MFNAYETSVHKTIMNNTDCTVLVCSCDKYADLLGPFLTLFRKYWPDCPFELALVTESEPSLRGNERFDRVIACGPDGNWCSRLVKALGEIATPYVLMLCDDYYLMKTVDTGLMLKRLEEMKRLGAANLRMIPNPKPTAKNTKGRKGDLFEYRKNTAYCIATQAGFWERGFLKRLAEPVASIWEFERYGSFAVADDPRPLLVTPTREFPFVDAVHKGCWERYGIDLLDANGIAYDLSVRGLPTFKTRLVEGLKALIFALFPHTLIVRVQNLLNVGMKEKQQTPK